MPIITLTTDFGLKDHFVGALKGKILSEFAEATIVDITHNIDPFNTAEASYIVSCAYQSFPKGTVHLIGVDLELSRENRHLAMQWNDHYFVCADNGILGMLTQKIVPQKTVAINIHDRLHADSYDTDVFVKVACHIARGGLLNVVGKETETLKQPTEVPAVIAADKNSIKGYVIYIDHLGNLVTNITRAMFASVVKGREFEITYNTRAKQKDRSNIRKIFNRYSEISPSEKYPLKEYEGTKLAVFNEAGFLEIGIFRSNPATVGTATSLLGIGYRDQVTINFL